MKTPEIPVTAALRVLRAAKADFVPRLYGYVDRGGARHAAEALGVDLHATVKTLVMEAQTGGSHPQPLLVLMHGDREVSTQQLARFLHAKDVTPASEIAVEKLTGYLPGGVSPFGTRRPLPVYVEETILKLDRIFINGGKRGFLVEMSPAVLTAVLAPTPVRVGICEVRS